MLSGESATYCACVPPVAVIRTKVADSNAGSETWLPYVGSNWFGIATVIALPTGTQAAAAPFGGLAFGVAGPRCGPTGDGASEQAAIIPSSNAAVEESHSSRSRGPLGRGDGDSSTALGMTRYPNLGFAPLGYCQWRRYLNT
jgi:hypothetical protein